MIKHRLNYAHLALLNLTIALLAGCGGGTGLTPTHIAERPSGSGVQAHVMIHVPSKSTTRRRPLFIPLSAQSISVQVDGGSPTVTDLTPISPNCVASASGTTCTIAILASAGPHMFVFTTYDGLSGTGNALASNTVRQTLSAGVSNTVNVTLAGIVSSVQFAVPNNLYVDTAGANYSLPLNGTVTLQVTPLDAAGDAIVGPGTPTLAPILSNPTGGTFSIAAVSGVPNTFTLTGPAASGSTALSFQVPGSTSVIVAGTFTAAILSVSPNPINVSISTQNIVSYQVNEPGYGGFATLTSDCDAKLGFADVAFASLANSVQATGSTTGTCTATFTDIFGQTANVTINVTP